MNKKGSAGFFRIAIPGIPSRSRVGLFSCLLLTATLLIPRFASAAELTARPDDAYLNVFYLIQQGDSLSQNGMTNAAMAKYREAQKDLLEIKQENPNWNPAMITYRLDYLAAKLNPPKPESQSETQSNPGAEESTGETSVPSAKAGPQIHLITAGEQPRKELRLHPKAGETQTLNMTLQMAMDMGMGQPVKVPPIEMPMTVTVKNVSSSGDATYDSVMGQPSVNQGSDTNSQMAAAMSAAFGMLKGMKISGTMSDHGINKAVHVTASASAPPQIRQTLDQIKESTENFGLPLPDEAVGAGAKWEVKMPIKSQGMTIQQTATYELVSIEGDQVHAKCTITQEAAHQTMQNPAMPNVKVNLAKLTSDGSGTLTFDLTRIFPTQAQSDSHVEMTMGVNAGGRMQNMTMKMDVSVQLNGEGPK